MHEKLEQLDAATTAERRQIAELQGQVEELRRGLKVTVPTGLVEEEQRMAETVASYGAKANARQEEMDKIETQTLQNEALLKLLDAEMIELDLQQRENKCKEADELVAVASSLHEHLSIIAEQNAQSQGDLTEELSELLISMEETGREKLPSFLQQLDAAKEKRLVQEADVAEQLLEMRQRHAKALSDAEKEFLRWQQDVVVNTSALADLRHEMAELQRETATAQRKVAVEAAKQAEQVKDLQRLVEEIEVLSQSASVPAAKAAARCLNEYRVSAAARRSFKTARMEKELRLIQCYLEISKQEERIESEIAQALQALQQVKAAESTTRNLQATQLRSAVKPLRRLYQRKTELDSQCQKAVSELRSMSIQAKDLAARLLFADPSSDHAIPLTPKPKQAKRGQDDKTASPKKKLKQ